MLEFWLSMALGAACYVLGRMHGWRKAIRECTVVVNNFTQTWKDSR